MGKCIIKPYTMLIVLITLLSIQSCEKNITETLDTKLKQEVENTWVNPDNVIYSDLTEFSIDENPETKALTKEELVPLVSLLKKESAITLRENKGLWTFTPIKQTEKQYLFMSNEAYGNYKMSYTSDVRKYLVESPKANFVATMIPYYKYSKGNWNYVNKKGFYGNIIYSLLDGTIIEIENIYPGRSNRKYKITQHPKKYGEDIEYINIIKNSTRAYQLQGSICIGYNGKSQSTNEIDLSETCFCPDVTPDSYFEDNYTPWDRGSSGGGSSSSPTNSTITKEPSVIMYDVNITIQGKGTVDGDGKYGPGAMATLTAIPSKDENFLYWTGDITGIDATTHKTVNKDINATAVFSDKSKPCYNQDKDYVFPLGGENQRLAMTSAKTAKSGSFGTVRTNPDGTPKNHNGWDIYAEPGTEFFAPVQGVISSRIRYNVPNNKDNKGGAGNMIGITFDVNGNKYDMYFFHLAYTDTGNPQFSDNGIGNGIGINPRTGAPWISGDIIYPGEILGCTGATGCAWNVPEKHLHVEIKKSGQWNSYIDPAVIFGDILTTNSSGTTINTHINTECDEMDSTNEDDSAFIDFYEMIYPQK